MKDWGRACRYLNLEERELEVHACENRLHDVNSSLGNDAGVLFLHIATLFINML